MKRLGEKKMGGNEEDLCSLFIIALFANVYII
jgi:hypothetical protein